MLGIFTDANGTELVDQTTAGQEIYWKQFYIRVRGQADDIINFAGNQSYTTLHESNGGAELVTVILINEGIQLISVWRQVDLTTENGIVDFGFTVNAQKVH